MTQNCEAGNPELDPANQVVEPAELPQNVDDKQPDTEEQPAESGLVNKLQIDDEPVLRKIDYDHSYKVLVMRNNSQTMAWFGLFFGIITVVFIVSLKLFGY